MEIEKAIKSPLEDQDWIKKILIGGIISLIPIVNFIATGYIAQALKRTMQGEPDLPEWGKWVEDFIRGLKVAIIGLIYLLIPILIIISSVGTATLIRGELAAVLSAGVGILIAIILALILGFMLPMAIAIFMENEDFGAAFRFGEVIERIKMVLTDYIVAYAVLIILGFVVGFLGLIPVLGFILVIFGNFYIGLVAAKMFGELYTESTAGPSA